MKMTYRPEIDGMRAIAVLAVLVYHLRIPLGDGKLLEGGFLGVDLFFVLSGYLITRILLQEIAEEGRIGFGRFYARRARRILPPLLLVMLVSLPAAWAILMPSEITRFGLSLLATLGFASNFFWFVGLGEYGSQDGLLQPFLHTWSLAIEEQFYLVFPLVLLALVRVDARRAPAAALPAAPPAPAVAGGGMTGSTAGGTAGGTAGWAIPVGIGALMAISLAVSQVTSMRAPDFSFFSPLSRAWELLAGSALAWLSLHRPGLLRDAAWARYVPSVALAVIAGHLAVFGLEDWAHPGVATVPFIAATCALMWFARPGEPVTALLSTRPAVFVGKISYSLYLWHFPVFAFGRLIDVEHSGPADWAAWLAITFALSVAGYYLVERPFRFRLPGRAFAGTMIAGTAAVVLAGGILARSDGLGDGLGDRLGDGRLAHLEALYPAGDYDNGTLRDASWGLLDGLDPGGEASEAQRPTRHEREATWFAPEDARRVLVIGNSHSKDMFNALALNRDAFPATGFARFAMSNAFDPASMEALRAAPNFRAADTVAIAPRYTSPRLMARLPEVIATLQADGKRVVIVDNTAEFRSPGTVPLFDWHLRRTGDAGALPELARIAPGHEQPRVARTNARLREIAAAAGAGYLSRRDLVCDDAAGTCDLVTPEGHKTLYDYGHWTLAGAAHFGARAAERGWFR
jgi:peptidoglycan/LPS O-acetylase OafA/YrhL